MDRVRSLRPLAAVLFLALGTVALSRAQDLTSLPSEVGEVIAKRCLECHDELSEKGGINLDHAEIDWTTEANLDLWHKTYNVVAHRQMPPLDEPQLTPREKQLLLTYLDGELTEHAPFGGALPRRLNRLEYRNSIRLVFRMSDFDLPPGFPKDQQSHGFDTVSEALVLSPPLLDSYREVAGQIADNLFPPEKKRPPVTKLSASVDDLVLSFSAATLHGDALRLASRSESIMRSCTWPSKIEIRTSGVYRITVDASSFRPKNDEPMKLEIRARDLSQSDRSRASNFRLLKELEITDESPETFTFEAELYEGQTPLLRWSNADLNHEPEDFAPLLKSRFSDPRFLAAWQEMLFPGNPRSRASVTSLRGRNGWDIFLRHFKDPDLNLADATPDNRYTRMALEMARNDGIVNALGDTFAYKYHEHGPALEIHGLSVEGPFEVVEGPKDRQRRSWQEWSFSNRKEGESDEAYAARGLRTFLPRLFRRPVGKEVIDTYLEMAKAHWAEGHRFEDGMHLVVRNALVSPRFLFREITPGKLDQHELANRLAFFLTRKPATSNLVHHARAGALSDRALYRSEAERLLPRSSSAPMIRDFTAQWLHTRLLPTIMPDEKFEFSNEEIELARKEVEHFFFTMLDENLPLRDFIDPDFLTTSKRFASEHYGYQSPDKKSYKTSDPYRGEHLKIERLPIERGGRRGGLLAQSAVLMATANGVDTQPVLRGVWVLENILGTPLPPVPSDVPALTPDVRGATTPRDLLAAHTESADCRGCHQQIDPIGFVLENFDPIGDWRTQWPEINEPIDPSGTLPDGTEILDYTDFKQWLVENIHLFSECLAEKLMIYATGRVPSYAEKKELAAIVAGVEEEGGGFRDLIVELVDSRTFRTR